MIFDEDITVDHFASEYKSSDYHDHPGAGDDEVGGNEV